MPRIQLLSNGAYQVMITEDGGGFSRWNDMAITRWREDASLDPWGSFCYLRDDVSGAVWSNTRRPVLRRAEQFEYNFDAGRAAFARREGETETRTQIAVSRDDAVELRRMVITNLGSERRMLCATSYAELVLASAAADAAHPAFSKLFVETSINADLATIFATRRPSGPGDPTPWIFHSVRVRGATVGVVSFETDRKRFIGRGRTTSDPRAMDDSRALSGSAGAVLDAVTAIRVPMTLDAGASITIDWFTGIAPSRDECDALARRQRRSDAGDRIVEQEGAYRHATLRRLKTGDAEADTYVQMAAAIFYVDAARRTDADVIARNRLGQSALWRFGISGDVPLVLLTLGNPPGHVLLRQLLHAHAYWRAYGIGSELAVVCPGALTAEVNARVLGEVDPADRAAAGKAGGVFVIDDAQLDDSARTLLQSVARLVVGDGSAGLEALHNSKDATVVCASGDARSAQPPPPAGSGGPAQADLFAFNGLGGFSEDGREYVITSSAGHMTPAPWVNVIANPSFGTLVSESGSATTWNENAHEFRLTPWSNDPVVDANTEALYVRDEDTGRFWSPTLLPTGGVGPFVARHGFGYSLFEHTEDVVESRLCVFVAIDAPVKFSVLSLRNLRDTPIRLSVTGYVEWVLGDEREKTRMHVVTERDAVSGALFANNHYNTDFVGRTAFFDVEGSMDEGLAEACADRSDFFGPEGTLAAPAALSQARLSGRFGAALDPCAALRVGFTLSPGQTEIVVFKLGVGTTAGEARDLVRRWRQPGSSDAALEAVHAFWRHSLGAVQVQTPDRALNALANGWLLYQVIASRLWGRTAFYQSSGAFGFRDQLQDVMALVHAAPGLVREHLLRAASRQFVEGDAQHWWHPPSGKGVRTRCSDDFLWLPLATCRYVEVTGDRSVLDETCALLQSRLLHPDETSNYELPTVSAQSASLYEHGVLAIRHGLRFGVHGLPLMGSGDWNDGMNLVGVDGRGESVWVGFFLITVLQRFAPLARAHADPEFARLCEDEAQRLRTCIETSAWDGDWYRRAWFDDGTLLGSVRSRECQIDSIAQSWSVLSGAASPERARRAMAALHRRLVNRDMRLVQLLDPPFDASIPSPGYIQGYVPGARENGGQYTHAAVWAAMAFAVLGDAEHAWELFDLLNPLSHADDAAQVNVYQVEPYVVAGDVYAVAPHAGRGGWTWYTGSAGWMLQLILESLLGMQRKGNQLRLCPLLPPNWEAFELSYRFGASVYAITCQEAAPGAAASLVVDGIAVEGNTLALIDDGRAHTVLANVIGQRGAADIGG